MKLCPVSRKRCYTSPAQAKRMCKKISGRLRIYVCPNCGSYHVTKHEFHA